MNGAARHLGGRYWLVDGRVQEGCGRGVVPVHCAWFLRCTNHATRLEPHPILGQVPICDRCHEFVEAMR